jgi:Ketopantoate reductase PanE/ApbA C terminal
MGSVRGGGTGVRKNSHGVGVAGRVAPPAEPRRAGDALQRPLRSRFLTSLESSAQKNPRWQPSLLQDLIAGRRLELEDLVGVIVHTGTRHGIPTPVIRVCYMLLKPCEMGTTRPEGQVSGEGATRAEGGSQSRA